MAHPNEALLRETYEAVGQGDLQVLLDALADDVRWADSSLGPHALDALSTLVMRTAKPTTPKRPGRSRFGVPKSGYRHGR